MYSGCVASEHVQKAVAALQSALSELAVQRQRLDDEMGEVRGALVALGVSESPASESTVDGRSIRARLVEFAEGAGQFSLAQAIEAVYGVRYVERSKYSTVSSALAGLVRDKRLARIDRGQFASLGFNNAETPSTLPGAGVSVTTEPEEGVMGNGNDHRGPVQEARGDHHHPAPLTG